LYSLVVIGYNLRYALYPMSDKELEVITMNNEQQGLRTPKIYHIDMLRSHRGIHPG